METQEEDPHPNLSPFTLLPTMQRSPNDNFSEPPAKRRRGRPFGAKNKPKPSSFLRPHLLEISVGGDITEAVKSLARCLSGYVSILTANGPVSSAVLKQPSCSSTADLTLCGCYEIVSMSTFFLGGDGGEGISVTMAGLNGEVVGGILAGPLVAAGKVVMVVAELSNPRVHDFLAVKELDSVHEERSRRRETERNEEEEFQKVTRDEAANFVVGVGNGRDEDDDEWCRNWFGQCEKEVRQRLDLSMAGETGSGICAGGSECLFNYV